MLLTVLVIVEAVQTGWNSMLADLQRLVNLDSPTREKAFSDRVAGVLADLAQREGMAVELDSQERAGNNVVARLGGQDSRRPSVLMVGHYDTAFPSGEAAARPFRVEGGRAYGPGVFDMKGGLVIGLHALRAVREAAPGWDLPVTFIFNSDEEDGSWGSRELIVREARRHDLALILEPSDAGDRLITARKGGGTFRLRVEGKESHAGAAPEEGRNSILEMAHKIVALEALARPEIGTTVAPGVIHGGTKSYVVPGLCELELDVRVPDEVEQARIQAALPGIVGSSHVPGTRAELTGQIHRPPTVASKATRSYARLVQDISQAFEFPLETGISGSGSDGNFTAAAGVPTLDGLGPHGGRHHSPEEYLELESLEKKTCILAGFLAALWEKGPRVG